jgi:hypothetical protein
MEEPFPGPTGRSRRERPTSSKWHLLGPFALLAAALPLARTFPLPGVSLADLALAVLIVAVFVSLAAGRSRPSPRSWMTPLAALVAWTAVAGSVLLLFGSALPFSAQELWKSFAKLVFCALGAVALAQAIARLHPRIWREVLLWALAGHSAIGLYAYLAKHYDFLPLAHLWAEERSLESLASAARFGTSAIRLRGLAAEPANLGYYLALGLAAVLIGGRWPRRRPWREILVLAAILLTLSLGTYVLAVVAAVGVVAANRHHAPGLLRGGAGAALAVLLIAALLPAARDALRVTVTDRAAGLLVGTADPAEFRRLEGSWASASLMVQASPWLGAGIGNYDVALREVIPRVDARLGMTPKDQGWTVPTYVMGTLGWPGLLLLFGLLWTAVRANPWGGALLAVATLADGTFLGVPFWFFLVLLAEPVPRDAAARGEELLHYEGDDGRRQTAPGDEGLAVTGGGHHGQENRAGE